MPPQLCCTNLQNKLSIVTILNKGHTCGYHALAVAKYYCENGNKIKSEWQQIRRDRQNKTTCIARKICRLADVDYRIAMTYKIIDRIQVTYPYQIIVYGEEKNILYKGSDKLKQIYLYNTENHYNMITSITGFLSVKNYCSKCDKGYQNMHKCSQICDAWL